MLQLEDVAHRAAGPRYIAPASRTKKTSWRSSPILPDRSDIERGYGFGRGVKDEWVASKPMTVKGNVLRSSEIGLRFGFVRPDLQNALASTCQPSNSILPRHCFLGPSVEVDKAAQSVETVKVVLTAE